MKEPRVEIDRSAMAGHVVSPGVFKSKDAEPEATLELLEDYCEVMERVFRLRRRIHPATGAKIDFDEAEKKDLILVEGGDDMQNLFKYVGQVAEGDTYTQAMNKIKVALKKRGNRTSAVFKLFNGHAQGSQSFESWHMEVFKAAKLIDWTGYDAKTAAVDAIITQTSSSKLQQKAIQENPSYAELVDLGISQEQARKKSTKLPDGESETVKRLKQENKKLQHKLKSGAGGAGASSKKCEKCCISKCRGGSTCFAEGKKCSKCGNMSHFAASKLCPERNTKQAHTRKVEEAEDSDSDGSEQSCGRIVESRAVAVAKVKEGGSKETIFCKLKMFGGKDSTIKSQIKLATDTGVKKTILNRLDWERIRDGCHLVKTKLKFRPYGTNERLPIRGRARVELKAAAGARIKTFVYVNDDDTDSSLLGEKDALRLGIVKINLRGEPEEVDLAAVDPEDNWVKSRRIKQTKLSEVDKVERTAKESKQMEKGMKRLVDEYQDIFGGVGKYNGPEIKIQVRDNIKPVIQPRRKIPLHYVQPLEDHLKELMEEDVIEGPLVEEEEGTWISNLVITDKKWDGESKPEGERVQIRANLDCRELNEYVYQTHEPIPTSEELRHKLRGSDRFTTLDMVHSFHQFVLEEKARKLFTFRAPGGLYRYKRLVMGNNPASSEAHKRVKMALEGCKGVCQIKDDVLVYGTGAEHDDRVREVLNRFREAGLTLRREKCYMGQEKVKWFGMIYSAQGMTADPAKTEVISSWPAPKTVRDVKSFLQTVQFNSVYMAAELPGEMNYPELTAPLRELTKRKVKFTWTAKHQKHFDMIKERMCSDRVMVPFDPDRNTRLYSDGGPEGAQATVAQLYQHEREGPQWRPVAHTSRAWTETEKRYSQIEKESNALLTGIVTNKMYLLGKEFEAVVDHKPLLPLYNTPRRPKQMRIDRHRMKLAAYNFKVVHMPGNQIPCDYGSRAGCPKGRELTEREREDWEVDDDTEIFVNRLVEEQLPPAVTRGMLREACRKDKTIKMLMEDIAKGECRKSLTRYSQVFQELTILDGMVVRGNQLVIPEELQPIVVQLAHEGHPGFERTLGLLRETTWFPGMSSMVRTFVETCRPCQAAVPGTGQEPLKPTLLPDRPWQMVHADFKGPIAKKYYLHTVIDQYSKFPMVEVCTSTSWEQMEPMLENALSTLGNVEQLTTDGGPPYDSHDFEKFAKRMGFRHHICSPENPQANGFVEAFQKVLVKMVHTAVIEKQDPKKVLHRYLASYRAAPHKTTGKSPYELLFNRKMQTKLPQLSTRVNSKLDKEVRSKHDNEKEKQKKYVDEKRKAKEKKIEKGDQILIQQKKTSIKTPWDPEPFKVLEIHGSKVKAQRGEEIKYRAKNNVKQLKERPDMLKIKKRKEIRQVEEEEDLDVDMNKIRVLSDPALAAPAEPLEDAQQPPPLAAAPQAQEAHDENIPNQEEREEGPRRGIRDRKQTPFYNAATQELPQEEQEPEEEERRRMSPRERKRTQAKAAKTPTPRCRIPGHREKQCVGSRDQPGMIRTPSGKRREAWRTEEEEGQ